MKNHGKSYLWPRVQSIRQCFSVTRSANLATSLSTQVHSGETLVQKEDRQECSSQHYLLEQKLETTSLLVSERTNNYGTLEKITYFTAIKINEPRL